MEKDTLITALFTDRPFARNVLLWLSLLGTFVVLFAALWCPLLLWFLVVTLPVLCLCIIDLFQIRHSLRRNFPASARFRWFFEWLRPFLRSYIVEGNLDGRPYNHDERALIYARAKGEEGLHPFGTELDVYCGEYEWLAHSMKPNPDVEIDMLISDVSA